MRDPFEEASQFGFSPRRFSGLRDKDRCVLIKAENGIDITAVEGLIERLNSFFRASRDHSLSVGCC